ncbi:hypothetical protein HanRHA438_Chr05g0208881 [Helianthus annuus]|nr:hypothetical protein HanRHA438_Chr05g0208881 [Helianthus annuus]
MMLTRMNRKARPVVQEKSGEDAALWRIFDLDFKDQVEVIACAGDEDGFNVIIRDNFQVPAEAALAVELPQGKGDLGALRDPDAKGVPKKQVVKGMRFRQKKKHEAAVVPPLVSQGAGISPTRFRRYTDYVVVSDTLEGLGVPGGGAAGGGSSAGSKPAGEKKRKVEEKAAGAGEQKRPRLQTKRTTAVSQPKSTVVAEPQDGGFSLFDAPTSPVHDAAVDAGVNKEFARSPSLEVVTEPSVQEEDTGKKTVDQIFDTVDSSDNLIHPRDNLNLKFANVEKPKSPAVEKASDSASGSTGFEEPSIQPGESELEFYYRTYIENRSVDYHRPPWNVIQGDDISTDPTACKDILSGLGTPFEVFRARGLPRENRINQLSSLLVGSSIMANAIIEDYKILGRKEEENTRLWAKAEALTEEWAATTGLKQVRTLAKLLSDERKSWKDSWAKQNEKLFCVRQEVTNLKAANAALVKEKSAAEAVAKEAKEAEARAAKALEEANVDHSYLNKVVEDLKAEMQNRLTIVEEVTARVTEAEARAREVVEVRDSLSSSLDQLKADRDWMRYHGIGHIVGTILDAPENAAAVNELKEHAREAGFKAGYNRCISHMNPLYQSKFTDERYGFQGVDTEARYAAAIAAYNDLSIAAINDIDNCLEAVDYVGRLRLLYGDPEGEEEEETAGSGKGDAGTSGTKKDKVGLCALFDFLLDVNVRKLYVNFLCTT